MPQARSQTRGTAARSELNGRAKLAVFRGLKLKLPAKAPGGILFDIGDNNVTGTLRTLLGEDQLRQVREKVAADGLSLDETVEELTTFLEKLFSDVYGILPGE